MPPATWPCDQISGIVAELTETHQSPSKGGPRKPHSRAGSGGVTSICCPVANSPVTVFVPFQPVHSNPARTPLCIVTVMFDSVKFSIGCHKRRTCSANTSELAQDEQPKQKARRGRRSKHLLRQCENHGRCHHIRQHNILDEQILDDRGACSVGRPQALVVPSPVVLAEAEERSGKVSVDVLPSDVFPQPATAPACLEVCAQRCNQILRSLRSMLNR